MTKEDILIDRSSCVICDSCISHHKTINNFPVYMGVTEKTNEDLFLDQVWGKCNNCGCIQLMKLVPYEILYGTNHHYDIVGDLWKLHFNEFANFICNDNIKSICEIGAGNDYLANIILKNNKIQYSVIEPDANIKNNEIILYEGYLNEFSNILKDFDAIVYSHVIEHIFDPFNFLKDIYNNTKEDVVMYISMPNIEKFLKNNGSNGLNFEHTFYIDIKQFKYLLNKSGFVCIKEKKFKDHSYFLKIIKGNKKIKLKKIHNKLKLFDNMHSHIKSFIKNIDKTVNNFDGEIYIYGAHVFAQLLIYNNLNVNKINGILDSSIYKQNKRLYGTNLNVYDPKIIKDKKNVMIILKAGAYQKQIKEKIYNINKNAIILE